MWATFDPGGLDESQEDLSFSGQDPPLLVHIVVNLMFICLQYMQGRQTDVDILAGLLVGLNEAP